jgi:hypothetical protein
MLVDSIIYAHQGGGKVEDLWIVDNTVFTADKSATPPIRLLGVSDVEISRNELKFDGRFRGAVAVGAFVGHLIMTGNVFRGYDTVLKLEGTYNGLHLLIDNLVEAESATLVDFNNFKAKVALRGNVVVARSIEVVKNSPPHSLIVSPNDAVLHIKVA